jgi:hypothetical protein
MISYIQDGSTTSVVGDGATTAFGTDRWLNGCSVQEIAPTIFAIVPRARWKRSVASALQNGAWVQDIVGAITMQVIMEYLHLWDLLETIQLNAVVTRAGRPPLELVQGSAVLGRIGVWGNVHRFHQAFGRQGNLENERATRGKVFLLVGAS